MRLIRIAFILSVFVAVISPAGSASAAAAAGPEASCGDHQGCDTDNSYCTMRADTPEVIMRSISGDDKISVSSHIVCDFPPGAKSIHLGTSFLYRFTCGWYKPQLTWFCGGPDGGTSVGEPTNRDRWCGYLTHADSPGCVGGGSTANRYRAVGMTWFYDVKDKDEGIQHCFAFQQRLNGTFRDNNDVLHIFEEVDTFGVMYGIPSDGKSCIGVVGQSG